MSNAVLLQSEITVSVKIPRGVTGSHHTADRAIKLPSVTMFIRTNTVSECTWLRNGDQPPSFSADKDNHLFSRP